jgi:hypothetical protein
MPTYYLKYDYPGWGNLYHAVEARNQHEAIKKFLRGTKNVPESKVHVWKGHGLPEHRCGGKS